MKERGIPGWLQVSIEKYKDALSRYQKGETLFCDCEYCELQSDINVAEVEGIISSDTAWCLRSEYLGIEQE